MSISTRERFLGICRFERPGDLCLITPVINCLVTMDFPDAITGGLRRTTDVVRGILEKTRSDLTLGIRQKDIESRLDSFGQGLK